MRTAIEQLSKPEIIDRLALELSQIGVKVPGRDTAFFQAAVTKWLNSVQCDHKGRKYADVDDPVGTVRCQDCGKVVPQSDGEANASDR